MKTFAEKVILFNRKISFSRKLPGGIRIMNPFQENKEVLTISEKFYNKFYHDHRRRKFIIGINPGRLGAGATGIPFTDTKRLTVVCGIPVESVSTHEPSSVFIYKVIEKFGGARKFYGQFYINSICPLGFVEKNSRGNWVNCNYYDYPELFSAMYDFIIANLKKQISFGVDTRTCYVLGKKNEKFVKQINDKGKYFDSIVTLDHPRYIEQYKSKNRKYYIDEYLKKLNT
ncbi:MAG: SMUG2 DNA glycosylase family protein [Bacteroidia bacterium]|nr:SMUG2 DNA glycosylase family protein [Bacteroidia bacterium]